MLEIKVRNRSDAVDRILKYLPKKTANVCLTGGNFGLDVVRKIREINLDISKWEIFQTDERIDAEEEEIIQKRIIAELKDCKGFRKKNCHFMPYKSSGTNLEDFAKVSIKLPVVKFDLTFLSLGEDGHLAGHFENSIEFGEKIFCITHNAPKYPKKRLSYTLKTLSSSRQIILACVGDSKKEAFEKIMSGEGLHQDIKNHNNLIILRD